MRRFFHERGGEAARRLGGGKCMNLVIRIFVGLDVIFCKTQDVLLGCFPTILVDFEHLEKDFSRPTKRYSSNRSKRDSHSGKRLNGICHD